MTSKRIALHLERDEALVLFELLASSSFGNTVGRPEAAVLSSMLAHLEKELVEPFQQDYDALLAAARKSVLSRHGD